MKLVLGSILALTLPFAAAYADGPHHKPPQAAFDACAKAKQGDACSVKLHDRAIDGVCKTAHESSALVCHMNHPPGPPPEALAACKDKAAGDACSMTYDGHDLAGSCMKHRADAPLACRPSRAPGHGPDHAADHAPSH